MANESANLNPHEPSPATNPFLLFTMFETLSELAKAEPIEERFKNVADETTDLAKTLERFEGSIRQYSEDDLRDLSEVVSMLPLRGFALEEAAERLVKLESKGIKLTEKQLFAIASTDLFVEKAQHVLSRRSKNLYLAGSATVVVTFILLLITAIFISCLILKGVPLDILGYEVNVRGEVFLVNSTHALILRIFQATALSALVLVGAKFLIGLGRSFFHEAESLRQRRHALRFGRLYVYLKRGDIELDKLQEAFQWNKDVYTSYLDMKPEVITETVIQKLIDAAAKSPAESIKAVTDTLLAVVGKSKKD